MIGLIFFTLNIFYSSILNNWIGHKFHNLETSSPIIIFVVGFYGLFLFFFGREWFGENNTWLFQKT